MLDSTFAIPNADELRGVLQKANTVLLYVTPKSSRSEVLGYLLAFQNRLALHLYKVVIAEPYRRRGIARRLIKEALSGTKKSIATLHVDPQNKAAIALYHFLGFELDGVLEDYYTAGRPAHKLRKQLDNF